MDISSTPPNSTEEWKGKLFSFGHIAKGVVYSVIGGVALAGVIKEASNPGGMKDVLRWIQDQPFGQVLLVLMAIGLFSYCIWRWVKAIDDPGHEGSDAEGLVKRTGYAASGTVYGLLAVYAITLVTGSSSGSGGGTSRQDMLSQILSESWGQILVGVLAIIILGVGIYQFIRGIQEKYMEDLEEHKMDQREHRIYRTLGKAGHIARSVVYGVMAYFLARVALSDNAAQFRGIEGVLEYLGGRAFGTVLLTLVGLGLLLYGIFMFVKAKYHRVA